MITISREFTNVPEGFVAHALVRAASRLVSTLFAVVILFSSLLFAQQPQPAPAPPQPPPVSIGNLNLQDASLTQVIDQFSRLLKLNIIVDPRVKGSVTINTYGETRNLDARNVLELILRINDFGLVQEGDVFRVVPLAEATRSLRVQTNAQNIPEDDQIMLNMIFLKYVTVDELSMILQRFTGDNAKIYSYAPANLLFILDSRRNMRKTMDLIAQFDSDMFANQRVRLYELKDARPSDVEKDLESILKAISLDSKTSTVRFLPVDRISTLIAVAPNPGVFDTVETWLKKLDVPPVITTSAIDNYVYHVRYGRADCLAMALGQLFGYGGQAGGGYGMPMGSPYGAYGAPAGGYGYGMGAPGVFGGAYGGGYGGGFGGAYGGGYGNYGNGAYGAPNSFSSGFGGAGACMGGFGGGYGGPYGGAGYGYPAFGGYSAQAPAPTGLPGAVTPAQPGSAPAAAAAGSATATPQEPPPRIVPNPLDNSLIIQADAQRYQSILKILKQLDIPPRQILLEAKIYSIDLVDQFASGVTAAFQKVSGNERKPLASLANGVTQFSAGALVGQSRELLAYLSLQENATHAHILSEPSLIATDSIPASINVGSQIPVSTGGTTIPAGGNVAVTQTISGVNTGVTLNVNARVNPSGVVTLIINQEVSSPGQNNTGNALTPSFNQQTVQTQLTTQDGDTIAIGGVIGETTNSNSTGIPLISKIPYLGALFGSHTYSHERTELIIFMTPHVIYDTTDLLEASDELQSRIKKLRKYVKN